MERMSYEKNLFNQFRMVAVNEAFEITDERMIKAVTVNENLASLGISLKPADIVKLSKSSELDSFYDMVKEYIGEVKADPMYPDFPNQVMNMNEAKFRFHQLVHYFSTYGIEALFGVKVSKGWLPDVQKTEKTEDDDTLIPSKVISLIDSKDMYYIPLKKITSKRERATLPEKEIVKEAVKHISAEELSKLNVVFKENLMDIFYIIFDNAKKEDVVSLLHSLCRHTGDVFTCLRYLLTKHRYRLSTSQRRICVNLLESYPVEDFKANMILSNKKSENTHIVLNYISFNKFSKSNAHKDAVSWFRDGKLHSWESQMKALISTKDDGLLPFVAKRPGMMLRMVAWLLRLDYDKEEITRLLLENASVLSSQTLVTILTSFGREDVFEDKKEAGDVYEVIYKVLIQKLKIVKTPIADKKIYLESGIYDFDNSIIECNQKSEEGGYVRSGLAIKIPDTINTLRFFVYWNDKARVDVDLHANGITMNNRSLHVGWSGGFKDNEVVFSGDITHSDAAEYIDVNLDKTDAKFINLNIDLYSGKPSFGSIDECFVGIMAVNNIAENVKLYNPKNCYITHNLKGNTRCLAYGYIDVKNRLLYVIGKPQEREKVLFPTLTLGNKGDLKEAPKYKFTLNVFLKELFKNQNCKLVDKKEDADYILRLDKGKEENCISLLDENFFLDNISE